MSNLPRWNQIFVDVEREFPSCHNLESVLTSDQVEQLKGIENTADNFTITVLHGAAALGELLAHTANAGELTDDVAMSVGWFIQSIALMSMTMSETGAAAAYKLQNIPQKGGSTK